MKHHHSTDTRLLLGIISECLGPMYFEPVSYVEQEKCYKFSKDSVGQTKEWIGTFKWRRDQIKGKVRVQHAAPT